MRSSWVRALTQSPGGVLWDVTLNAGAGGATAATDVIGGVQFQKVKINTGAAGVDGGLVGPTNPLPVAFVPQTTGGSSDYHAVAAASTNAASIKGAAGQLYGAKVFNNAAYPVYVKFYNKATAPVPGTDTPVRTVGVQAGVRADDLILAGMAFALGIGIAITKGIADNDNTAVAISDCVVDVDYK